MRPGFLVTLGGLLLTAGCATTPALSTIDRKVVGPEAITIAHVDVAEVQVKNLKPEPTDPVPAAHVYAETMSIPTIITSRKSVIDLDSPIEFDLRLPSYDDMTFVDSYSDSFTHAVTFNATLFGRPTGYGALPDRPLRRYKLDMESREEKLDPRIFFYVPREIVRSLAADGLGPARFLYRLILKGEKIGRRVQNIRDALSDLYTVPILDIVDGTYAPIDTLIGAVTDPKYRRRRYRAEITIGPSIMGETEAGKIGKAITENYLHGGKKKLDPGIALVVRFKF